MADLKDQFVDVRGFKTRYWKAGNTGSAVVLLAGIGCSVSEWRNNIEALAGSHQVYALDMLGGGKTDKPAGDHYSIAELARFTLDFLSNLGEEKAHFIGNSLGGRIALECARIAPSRVLSMVLVAPAGVGHDTHINMRLPTIPVLGELITRPSRGGLRMLWGLAFHDRSFVTDELVEEKYAFASLPGAQAAFLKTLRGFVSLGGFPRDQIRDLQVAMPSMTQPTLVVWGRDDKLLPVAHARILEARLPSQRQIIFDACGHAPQVEKAAAFNKAVLEFLQTVQ
jgi:4,5:9,10-diseco-3-hydroxy-5,9,17-trioxoandrosta-1(10),2-diene-4-oate hydrolase